MNKKDSLRKKLFYFSVAIILVPMIILYSVILAFFNYRSDQENKRYSYHDIQNLSHMIDSALSGLNEISLYIVSNANVREYLGSGSSFSEFVKAGSSLQFLPFTTKYYTNVTVNTSGVEPIMAGGMYSRTTTAEEEEIADSLAGASFWYVSGDDVFLIRQMRDQNRITRPLGYIKIQVDTQELSDILKSPDDLPNTNYMLLTESGIMLQTQDIPDGIIESEALSFGTLAGKTIDSKRTTLGRESYRYSSRTVNNGKVVVVSFVNENHLRNIDALLIVSFITAFVLTAFFVYILVMYYTRRVFDPLEKLGEVMSHFDQEDFESDFRIPGSNEITRLVDQFNLMCRRINTLHRQIYMSDLKLKESELAILQSEINPHFLYNTLDTIYWMSEESKTWKISIMVHSLANLFRIALHKTPSGLVPLAKEQEYMKCYLTIQQVRYQEQFSFEFYMQEDIGDINVLKLLLQPIVENAIIHGIEPRGRGRIIINVYTEDDEVIYKVFNDGAPVDIDEMTRLMQTDERKVGTRGLGISNVNTRVQLRFGEKYGLTFENPLGGGVLATIRQPLLGARNDLPTIPATEEDKNGQTNDCR